MSEDAQPVLVADPVEAKQRFLTRAQIGGAAAVAIGYFLPWASILSPFGSLEVRGLHVDYGWVVLLLALLHLGVQTAESNQAIFPVDDGWRKRFSGARRILPGLIVAGLVWFGSSFQFNLHAPSGPSLLGSDVTRAVRAGLDYGFWISASGAMVLLVSVAIASARLKNLLLSTGLLALAVGLSAFGMSRRSPTKSNGPAAAISLETEPSSASTTAGAAESSYDFSQTIQVLSVSAKAYGKNYEAGRYSNSIVITPVFRNLTDKTIIGIRGRITVLDGFGRAVYSFGFRDDDKLPAKTDSKARGGYNFDDNQFSDDEPYDKMYALVTNETAKYQTVITEVAFADGTTLPGR